MARFVVPVAVLVALISGYVVGQQPPPEQPNAGGPLLSDPARQIMDRLDRNRDGALDADEASRSRFMKLKEADSNHDGMVNGDELSAWAMARITDGRVDPRLQWIGRYVPADGGKMLDTTNGTLFAQEGSPAKWKAVATLGY